ESDIRSLVMTLIQQLKRAQRIKLGFRVIGGSDIDLIRGEYKISLIIDLVTARSLKKNSPGIVLTREIDD
ncbi:hypothetical protein, partial [Bacillus cereus]|uniref:hypothetical protein n=1 Tax=Bacillus cereus TaxID=1396 RepID=UPI0024BE490C